MTTLLLASSIVHTMPVSIPVRKYLEAWKPGIYEAKMYDFIGTWLINAMSRKTVQVKEMSKSQMDTYGLTEQWRFAIPARYEDSRLICQRRVLQFNKMILKFMHAEIMASIQEKERNGDKAHIQSSIDDFRNKYGILEKHLEDYRIRKMYQRFKARNGETQIGKSLSIGFQGMVLGAI